MAKGDTLGYAFVLPDGQQYTSHDLAAIKRIYPNARITHRNIDDGRGNARRARYLGEQPHEAAERKQEQAVQREEQAIRDMKRPELQDEVRDRELDVPLNAPNADLVAAILEDIEIARGAEASQDTPDDQNNGPQSDGSSDKGE